MEWGFNSGSYVIFGILAACYIALFIEWSIKSKAQK